MKHVVVYTDGSCSNNPGPGGWAAIVRYNQHERVLTGSHPATTNNRMEMTAALEALRALKYPCKVYIYTDSTYLKNGFAKGWVEKWRKEGRLSGRVTSKGKKVKNPDLWLVLWQQTQIHDVTWIKVKAHADNALNNRVDALAVEARNAGLSRGV